ncbi:hypothetical protein F2981_28805 (plasmid) [Sinorhizobium meliloti]|nr:hypothetical protein [Sinorhizobium meliloti]
MVIPQHFLGIAAIGFCCWLLFILAIFALPAFAGVTHRPMGAIMPALALPGALPSTAFLSHNWRANMRPTCRTTSVALPRPALVVLLIDALLGLRSLPIKRPLG